MIVQFLLIFLGFVLLVKGADYLVEGASSFAKKHNVSELVIGLTIVSFGTSAPELVVNLLASINGHDQISISNIVGSNMFNTLMIFGVCGMIVPLSIKRKTVWKEIPFLLLATLSVFGFAALNVLGQKGHISRFEGIFLLAMMGGFLYYLTKYAKDDSFADDIADIMPTWKITVLVLGGLAALMLGGELVVSNAVKLAKAFGVSEKLVGLTIVALGTSLPEFVTSVIAVSKKSTDIAVGNVIGSNVFNLLLVLGTSSVISPIAYDPKLNIDLLILSATTVLLFISMFTFKKHKLDRWESILFVLLYVGYTGYILNRG